MQRMKNHKIAHSCFNPFSGFWKEERMGDDN
uniref:Uncharacterized protein n=1 Tax=Rhizophora mucronata TaxID=61149 RepID=A0A2P2QW39_RHIMU